MVEGTEVLAVIPARGGSKGFPGKNIYPFLGHPLIAYSIAAAKQSALVKRVIVTTDDEKIAEISLKYGAEVPFMRPSELAQDNTPDLPVFQHVYQWLLENENYKPDVIVQLRPTSPVRPPRLIDQAIQMLFDHPEADSIRGIVPSSQNPYKMWRIDAATGRLVPLLTVEGLDEPYNSPRQILPQTYWQIGLIDAFRPERTILKNQMSGSVIYPVMLDTRYAIDIDTYDSLKEAEAMIRKYKIPMVYPGNPRRPLPAKVALVVFDFDGVLTDNRVWVNQHGEEMVAAYRSDSLGINRMRKAGIEAIVISTETNPVVTARCKKMNLPVIQGVEDKVAVLTDYLLKKGIDPSQVVFLGNDFNDIPCFPLVGCAVVVNDAQPEALEAADIILSRKGGFGAVRELCDMLLDRK